MTSSAVRTRLLWALPAIALASLFALLGQWQLGRGREKQAMMDAVARAERGAVLELRRGVAIGAERPLRVSVRGEFEAGREILLDNQPANGRAGVRVLTPFKAESGHSLLVDRGWLAIDPATRRPAAIAPPSDHSVALRGLLTALPGVGLRLGDGNIDANLRHPLLAFLDADELRSFFGADLVDGVVRMDADLAGGFDRTYAPVPSQMPPARHQGYAVQWFALSAAVLVTWLLLAFRRT